MGPDWNALRLTYGITPPKLTTPEPRRREIAAAQAARIAGLPIDALVVYDLQDESSRTDAERPFPFLRAIDPLDYAYQYLGSVAQSRIIYRSVSGLSEAELVDWLTRLHGLGGAAVLVGAPSRAQAVGMHLSDAYRARSAHVPELALGGVAIAERHEIWVRRIETLRSPGVKVLNYFHGLPADDGSPYFWSDGVHFTCHAAMAMLKSGL